MRGNVGDNDTFKLLLFFIGNGCSPEIIAKWILTSQHWTTHTKGEKRAINDFLEHGTMNKFEASIDVRLVYKRRTDGMSQTIFLSSFDVVME